MSQRVSWQYPDVPAREGGWFLEPTVAEFLNTIAHAANHFTGWRFLPFARYSAGWAGDVYRTKTFSRDDIHRIPLHPQPRTVESYLAVVIYYQAGTLYEAASDATAAANGWSIEATLETYAGAAVDDNGGGAACKWTKASGTLPVAAIPDNGAELGPEGENQSAIYPVLTVTTGMQVETAPVSPTRPRPLIVPSTVAGSELLLLLETVNVRILGADVWQMWRETLE